MSMQDIFRPDEKLDKYDDFDIEGKIREGFSTILLDVDNTITPHYQKIPDEKGKDFVRKLKAAGFKVIVFSNNIDERVGEVARALDCEYYCWALKPLPFKFSKAMREHKLKREEVICMGDQLLTDILGGNVSGVHTIYVRPIVESDSRITSFNRRIERFVFKHILHEKV
ncbi:MAG: YqeG family HAD IIIA-type phosphatase [Erysipelotrichaceae bacterium]|nr:YqeG family HAD IIIA-type phosphatase [Erysipelotrichaceae bacterium]